MLFFLMKEKTSCKRVKHESNNEISVELLDLPPSLVEVVTKLTSIALGMTPGSDLLPVRVKVFPDLRFERNEEGKERSAKRTRPSKGEMWDSRSLSVSKDHSVESLHRRSTHCESDKVSSFEVKRNEERRGEDERRDYSPNMIPRSRLVNLLVVRPAHDVICQIERRIPRSVLNLASSKKRFVRRPRTHQTPTPPSLPSSETHP